MRLLPVILLLPAVAFSQPGCGPVSLAPSVDRAWLTAAGTAGSQWQLLVNGQAVTTGQDGQTLLLHADSSTASSDGLQPLAADGVSFASGRWGDSFQLDGRATLSYPRAGSIDFNEGTIEMWVALRQDSGDPVYASRDHTLFSYRANNGETLSIVYSHSSGVIYAAGTVRGQYESAYDTSASATGWLAGEWHHLAFTFSSSANHMRFYVDGVLAADTNERHYWPPEPSGDRFTIGGAAGTPAAFWIDEVRILSRALAGAEIRTSAHRISATLNHEVLLPATGLQAGDRLVFQAGGCPSATLAWTGIPLVSPTPPSTLLAANATSLDFSVDSVSPASCTWSVNAGPETPFDGGQGSTSHHTQFRGLSPDPTVVNQVAVRCDSDPGYTLALQYRALPPANPAFPRKGNLWGSGGIARKGLDYAARLDLYLGASFTPSQIRRLRALNPHILILTSINAVENSGLNEDYYLHDVTGQRIEVWPNTFRLNLTKPYVAEYQARFAYQTLLDSGLMADGVFFDNFFTAQSWLKADIYGKAVQIDANEDGQPDDAATLDAAWRTGVYHELNQWRRLMPFALASGHLPDPPQTDFAAIFNGDSIGFLEPYVLEGRNTFQSLWDDYQGWFEIGRQPVIAMMEAAPQTQISYGYGFSPSTAIPAPTLEFARTYYPNMRFGLGVTLMNDGYFAYEFGDTWHGNDWWYDELDYNLGYPLGAARRSTGAASAGNIIDNGGFEDPLSSATWRLTVNPAGGAAARLERDLREPASGSASAHITVTNAGQGVDWHVEFAAYNRSLIQGRQYDLVFWARASAPRPLSLSTQQGQPPWVGYGLARKVTLDTTWKSYAVTFQATATAQDARLQFWLGAATGEVWIDDVQLVEHPADVFVREFTNGLVVLNATAQTQTVALDPGYQRLAGSQAPRYQYIIDDNAATLTGTWRNVTYDTGQFTAIGPFYHAWNRSCRVSSAGDGQAEWNLGVREDDTYTIQAWWAAAPAASTWTKRATYEVVAGGRVVATATLDQSTAGDQWHTIATVPLTVKDAPVVRLRGDGSGPLVADALHIRSAARYNDGSRAATVTLQPMDAVVLAREK